MTNDLRKFNILLITHPWGGGIATYLEDLRNILRDRYIFFTLKSENMSVSVEYETAQGLKKDAYSLTTPTTHSFSNHTSYQEVVAHIVNAYEIDLIHINSTIGHTFDIFDIASTNQIPLICTIHDFFYICPTFHLVDKDGMYCDRCKFHEEKDDCLLNHPYIIFPNFNKHQLNKWRQEFFRVKSKVDAYIFPSFSAKEIFTSFYNLEANKCHVIYHGTALTGNSQGTQGLDDSTPLNVGILGSMLKHKGENLLKDVLKNVQSESIRFYHFGDGSMEDNNLTCFGAYPRKEIIDILKQHHIDVILLLSTWPETFSYTLSESLAAGIPVIVTNLGALKERVEQDAVGWIVDYKKSEEICTLLHRLQADRSEVARFKQRISDIALEDLETMKVNYYSVFSRYLAHGMVKHHDNNAVRLSRQKLGACCLDGSEARTGRASLLKLSYLLQSLKYKFFEIFSRNTGK